MLRPSGDPTTITTHSCGIHTRATHDEDTGMARLILAVILVQAIAAYRMYQDRIPNGDTVPHPCKPNYLWRGVGHKTPLGGGLRNTFGEDYGKIKQWTPELCRMDSDNDGLTNGQELGDPDCVWVPGTFPSRSKNITHPGVCDPWGSSKCEDANSHISCDTGEFLCDAINSPDVINITLRFPPTQVPPEVTTYMCYTFDLDMLPAGVEYHLIATKPYIDNADIMHHTVLSGCDFTSSHLDSPQRCNMGSSGCRSPLSIWTLGLPGSCVYKDAGFKIGRNGYKRLNMLHHWNNPEKKTTYTDSSGITLYLTPKLRKYNAAYMTVGETLLNIPPGRERVVHTSQCSSECTRDVMKGPIHLLAGYNHMHYLGYQQTVEHYRNGEKLRDLTPDDHYSYDNPIIHKYDPQIEMLPGDSLKTTCVHRSTSRATTTVWGDGTNDEMCFGFFTFYPAENMPFVCVTYGDLELCSLNRGQLHGCNIPMMLNSSHPVRKGLMSKVLDNCSPLGDCRVECPAALAEVQQHPCLNDRLGSFVLSRMAGIPSLENAKFLAAMRSCQCSAVDPTSKPVSPVNDGETISSSGLLFLIASLVVLGM
ncbi:tyramine beta-hydroxylase-like [Haliotis rufescens]|uniref:tyramine beta-hydroxylase-like n=1 Tax=Haliotis rufescens TaxID=6454 RepID=UPI00201F1F07|nr:tyramine beta-hydroxylase-like [Haliotis rufescens]